MRRARSGRSSKSSLSKNARYIQFVASLVEASQDITLKPQSSVQVSSHGVQGRDTRAGCVFLKENQKNGNARTTTGRIRWQWRTAAGSAGSGAVRGP